MKALRRTPEANPRVASTPSLEVTFELRSHLRVNVGEPRIEQGFDRVDSAAQIDVRRVGGFTPEETSLSLRIGQKLRYVAQRDLEFVPTAAPSLVHSLVLIVAGEQRHRRFDPQRFLEPVWEIKILRRSC